MTVRQKISKKQQREAEAKRRAAGRSKQAAYVARMKAEGKKLIRFWVTDEERTVLDKVRSMLPQLVELERQNKVSADPEETPSGGADLFLDYYAAKSKLLRYSNGLFAPKDSFILFSLYQCK